MAHVAGFTVAHDVSARDWQMRRNGKQWLLGKTFDTFCPLGPALVTKDSVAGRSLTAHLVTPLALRYVSEEKAAFREMGVRGLAPRGPPIPSCPFVGCLY